MFPFLSHPAKVQWCKKLQSLDADVLTYIFYFKAWPLDKNPKKNRALYVLPLKLSVRHDSAKKDGNMLW